MKQASAVNQEPVRTSFHPSDFFIYLGGAGNVAGRSTGRVGKSRGVDESWGILLRDHFNSGRTLPVEGCSGGFRHVEIVKDREIVRLGGIEMRRTLQGRQIARCLRYYREARLDEIEVIEFKCPGHKLGGIGQRLFDICVSKSIVGSNDPTQAGIIISSRWEGRKGACNLNNLADAPTKVVDDYERTAAIANMA